MRRVGLLTALGALAFVTANAQASACREPRRISLEIDVQEAPIVIMNDITLDQLRSASDRLGKTPAHPVLGFYAGAVGYALPTTIPTSTAAVGRSECPDTRLQVELVVVDRRIAIASELSNSPCRYRAALAHYQRHAAAASAALHRFASGLQARLQPEIELLNASAKEDIGELRRALGERVDAALGKFNDGLRNLQQGVDREGDTQRLSAPCDRT